MLEKEQERTYQDIRQGDDVPHNKPLKTVTKQPHESRHEKNRP